jgi:Ras-related protein Rab-18
MLRFVDDTFDPENPATIGVDFRVTRMNIDGNDVKLAIWDTGLDYRFNCLYIRFSRSGTLQNFNSLFLSCGPRNYSGYID